MKISVIIPARMSSTRLPGKALLPIKGKPMLWYVVSRALKAPSIDSLVIATSKDKSDYPIVEFCHKYKLKHYRGSLNNVLKRFYEAATRELPNVIIRLTQDCPLIDGELIEDGIRTFENKRVDYLSNSLKRTFPRGFDFEIFTYNALKKAYMHARTEAEKEHVTPYIYLTHRQEFKIYAYTQKRNKSKYELSVDTPQDFKLIKILIEKYGADKLSHEQITAILDSHPELGKINAHIKRKKLTLQ